MKVREYVQTHVLVHYLQKSTMVVFSHDSPYKKINTPARTSCAISVFHTVVFFVQLWVKWRIESSTLVIYARN